MENTPTASTISTGAGGVAFEQNVGAAFLALLLTRSFLPVYPDSVAERVHFQAKRLGWNFDDLVIEGKSASGVEHRLCAQIKRKFVVSAKNKECVKTFTAAWADFQGSLFNRALDALVLVTHLGSNRLLGDFGWLLTQARASQSVVDFEARLAGDGLLNKNSKTDFDSVKVILEEAVGSVVQNDAVLDFLKSFYILSFDFTDASAKDEASIKSTLRFLQNEAAPVDAAQQTWNELYVEAGLANLQGKSLDRPYLPADAMKWHREVPANEHVALSRMRDHSEIVLKRVANGGARGMNFPRSTTRDQIIAAAAINQVVFIVGAAGGGKSVLAKKYVLGLYPTETVFAFSAEEFKVPHIDQVLANAQIGLTWMSLRSLFPIHPKTFLIEGLERLLEGDDRGAMGDLLKAVADDPSLKLLITCRDYHAETVERSLLRPSGVIFERVAVPDLSDAELDEAQAKVPALSLLLKSPPLRALLRNPFMLSRVADLVWKEGAPLPQTERSLRNHLWNEVVKREADARDGMPDRRADSLTRISLDRAQFLQPFVGFQGDAQAMKALANDNLVVFDETKLRAAPAHDVFEDWALIEWLTSRYSLSDGDAHAFASGVSPYPAVRRAYRKWLYEMLESDAETAAAYVGAISKDSRIADYFRDDTLVAVFQSSAADQFLSQFGSMLMEDDAYLIRRVIHLVRVACKTVSPLAPKGTNDLFSWHIPSGEAWPALLRFLAERWSELPENSYPLVIGFLEDWAKATYVVDYPEGADSAGELLTKLLPVSKGGYRSGEKKRVMALLIRIPLKASALILDLMAKAAAKTARRDRDLDAELFDKAVFKPFDAAAMCRDFPDEFIAFCRSVWAAEPEAEDEWSSYRSSTDVGAAFGLENDFEHRMYPISAYQGPFLAMLRNHPRKGVEFIRAFVDDATEFFGQRRYSMEFVSAPRKVAMRMSDGSTREVWCNDRLWNAYRATSVMPGVLECALMAIEKWLLDHIQHAAYQKFVVSVLVWILEKSDSAALISVVASVCMAHPTVTKAPALNLLGCKEFFRLDLQRGVQEYGALAVGGLNAIDKIFQDERLESNKLPHRKGSLEDLARNLQLTDAKEAVFALLDFHRGQLPPLQDQDDSDRIWRLALDRMDMRRYTAHGPAEDGKVLFQMQKPAEDIQQMLDRDAPAMDAHQALISLYVWGRKAFKNETVEREAFDDWPARLESARKLTDADSVDDEIGYADSARNGIAAACLRHHWDEMDYSALTWCKEVAFEAVNQPLSGDHANELFARNPMNGSAECAFVIPLIATREDSDARITSTLMAALTHFNEEVKQSAISGVSEYVIGRDDKLASLCLWTLINNARRNNEMEALHRTARAAPRGGLADRFKSALDALKTSWATTMSSPNALDALFAGQGMPNFNDLTFDTWHDRRLATSLITLFRNHPENPLAEVFFEKIAMAVIGWWGDDRRAAERDDRRDFELEHLASRALGEYLLFCPLDTARRLTTFMTPMVSSEPKKAGEFLTNLLLAYDRKGVASNYWELWRVWTVSIEHEAWLSDIDNERSYGQSFLRDAFLNTKWVDGIRNWTRLEDHFKELDDLFVRLPASTHVLRAYADYLFHIGESSLPQAFALISQKFGGSLGASFISDDTLRWYVDSLVSRCLFEDLTSIRKSPALRTAVMAVLDALVQAGSSIAFQLRDDFVTPTASPNATASRAP